MAISAGVDSKLDYSFGIANTAKLPRSPNNKLSISDNCDRYATVVERLMNMIMRQNSFYTHPLELPPSKRTRCGLMITAD